MRLVTLGTGTVTPHRSRTSACHYVEAVQRLLLDCGAGATHRMAEYGVPWRDLDVIAITHFHADHWGELGALIFAMKYGALEPRSAPLEIIGPVGMRDKLERLAGAFGDWVTAPGFDLKVTEISPGERLLPASSFQLSACKTPHTDESLAYSIESQGKRLVYTGDTGPSAELGDWAKGCDLLLAECSLPESMKLDLHLTPRSAGALAARANAKRLVLTHLYPPVESVDIVGEVGAAYGGPVSIAVDGQIFDV